jgi:hypothetical protein
MAAISKAKHKLQRLRSMVQMKECQKFESDLHGNLDYNVKSKDKNIYDKHISFLSVKEIERSGFCKKDLMKRYLRDSARLNTLATRTRGDGCNESMHCRKLAVRTPGDGADSDELPDLSSVLHECQEFSLNKGFFSDDDASSDTTIIQQTRNELNECFVYSPDDVTSSNDEESAFEDDSECSSVCDFERNIDELDIEDTLVKMDRIKSAFSNGDLNARITEDTLLDSFMNTIVGDSSSDEGLSSVGSDFD